MERLPYGTTSPFVHSPSTAHSVRYMNDVSTSPNPRLSQSKSCLGVPPEGLAGVDTAATRRVERLPPPRLGAASGLERSGDPARALREETPAGAAAAGVA